MSNDTSENENDHFDLDHFDHILARHLLFFLFPWMYWDFCLLLCSKQDNSFMEIIRATKTAEQAGAYYVRIQAMARKHQIPLNVEFDEHDTPETKYIVVIDNYLPIATCRLYAINDEQVMLGRIVVLPEYRLQGLGTLVVKEAEKWAKELGYHTAIVESRDNKIHFYETMGYVPDYSQKIIGETSTCYRMEKEL